jgi:hypothetical protein
MENKMGINFLLIIGSNPDGPEKLSNVLDLLTDLRNEGIDVCFSTRSSYGLDKISDLCKYVSYDKNNGIFDQYDLINSLHLIDRNKIAGQWLEWFSPIDGIKLESFVPSDPSQCARLKLIKNGVSVSWNEGYKWTCYLEYNYSKPKANLRDLILTRISSMRSLDKKSFLLLKGNEPSTVTGRFMIFETSLLYNNPVFKADWQSSPVRWVSVYGNMFFEQILGSFLSPGNSEYAITEKENAFMEENWSPGEDSIDMDSYLDERSTLLGSINVSFYANRQDNGFYDLEIWAYNIHEEWSFHLDDFFVNFNNTVSNLNPSTIGPGGWYNIANSYSIDPDANQTFSFSYSFRNNQGSDQYRAEQTIRSGDLEKLSMIKRKNIEKY